MSMKKLQEQLEKNREEFEKIYPLLRICDKGSIEFKQANDPHRDALKSFFTTQNKTLLSKICEDLEEMRKEADAQSEWNTRAFYSAGAYQTIIDKLEKQKGIIMLREADEALKDGKLHFDSLCSKKTQN